MAVKVDWYLKGYVVFIEYGGVVGIDDIHQSYSAMQALQPEQRSERLHTIINSYGIERYNIGLKDISSRLLSGQSMGWTLNVVPPGNPTVKMMTNMFTTFASQVVGFKYRSFNTVEDAVAFLREQDDQIAALLD